MIAYVDSSLVARAYLRDEDGHAEARGLLDAPDVARVTGRWTRIEASGAFVRAERAGRHRSAASLMADLDRDLQPRGRIAIVTAPTEETEALALGLVRTHGLRALDALHLAVASIVLPQLARRGEPIAFASRDGDQATVAASLGFAPA